MTITDSLENIFNLIFQHIWLLDVFLVILTTALTTYLVKGILNRLYPRLRKTKTPWDEATLVALKKPLHAFIWVLGIGFAVEILQAHTPEVPLFFTVNSARYLGFITLFAWFLMRLTKEGEKILTHAQHSGESLDRTTVGALAKLTKASILVTTTLVVLQTFGIGISGVLAFGGISGAAVAFSAKDLLANFFGGLIIYLDRPFAVGDWIRLPGHQDLEGTVEHIGWRVCRIRTFDKRPLYVPNSLFTTVSIENPTRMSNRRIKTLIGLRYEDANKIESIVKDLENMLANHEAIDQQQLSMVYLVEFGATSLNILLYTFTKTTLWKEFQAIQQDVYLKAIRIINTHGAECAYPTTTVHIPEGIEWHKDK